MKQQKLKIRKRKILNLSLWSFLNVRNDDEGFTHQYNGLKDWRYIHWHTFSNGGDAEKWLFICVSCNHICRSCACLHHDNRASTHHTASLHLACSLSLSFIVMLCCGGLVDHGQFKQFPLSSHPPTCCHIKPDLQKATADLFQICVVVLANGKKWLT